MWKSNAKDAKVPTITNGMCALDASVVDKSVVVIIEWSYLFRNGATITGATTVPMAKKRCWDCINGPALFCHISIIQTICDESCIPDANPNNPPQTKNIVLSGQYGIINTDVVNPMPAAITISCRFMYRAMTLPVESKKLLYGYLTLNWYKVTSADNLHIIAPKQYIIVRIVKTTEMSSIVVPYFDRKLSRDGDNILILQPYKRHGLQQSTILNHSLQ